MTTMNRQAVIIGAVVIALGSGLVTHGQEGVPTGDPAKGALLLAEARQAIGGEKLAAVKALEMKGSFRRAAGTNQVEGDIELLLQLPDKMKRIEDTSAPGGGPAIVATQTLNGSDVWDENSGRAGAAFGGFGGRGGFGGGAPGGRGGAGGRPVAPPADGRAGDPAAAGGRAAIDPERLRQALVRQRRADFDRLVLGWLLITDAPVSWVGTAESPDGKADVLEIKPVDGVAARLFLDAVTHMPLMLTWQGAAPQAGRGGGRRGQPGGGPQAAAPVAPTPSPAAPVPGGDDPTAGPRRGGPPPAATLQLTFSDFKAVGGVRLPHTVTRGSNGQTTEEWSISSFKINPSIKADAFTQK
jgi:hypothetical protein